MPFSHHLAGMACPPKAPPANSALAQRTVFAARLTEEHTPAA
jgi:hypothetical protein